jgi:hypothetical protein
MSGLLLHAPTGRMITAWSLRWAQGPAEMGAGRTKFTRC